MFGDCGEIRFEARRSASGLQVRLLNDGSMLSAEWVPDLHTLLQRSAEVRRILKKHAFRERVADAALLGGPSWGPARPSATLVASLRPPRSTEAASGFTVAAHEFLLSS
jgi:hypothetical protein